MFPIASNVNDFVFLNLCHRTGPAQSLFIKRVIMHFKQAGKRYDEASWDAVASQSCLFVYILNALGMPGDDVACQRFVDGDYTATIETICNIRVPGSLEVDELRASAIGIDLLGPLKDPDQEASLAQMDTIMGRVAQADLDVPASVTFADATCHLPV